MMSKTRTFSLAAFAALLCLSLPAASQQKSASAQGPYQDVRIVVKDLSSDREIGSIAPGGTFSLPEGARVRLILTAMAPGRGRGPAYPTTEFTEATPGRGWVRITRTNTENANATLEIVQPSNANASRTETLRYRITETIGIPNNLREGSFTIQVQPAGNNGNTGTGSTGSTGNTGNTGSTSQARDLVSALYRGILLREPDEAGARTYIDAVSRGGYAELARVAAQIASSDESRIRLYERENVCNQQRLLALYKNLLGVDSNQVDTRQWDTYLRQMNAGDIDDVVTALVRSDAFRRRHNLS